MLKYYATFQNSDAGVERGNPEEVATAGPFSEFFQLTYALLRSGPDGDDLAHMVVDPEDPRNEEWLYNGQYYTDVVLWSKEQGERQYRCPTGLRGDDDSISGCGSWNTTWDENEELVDCNDCGIWFNPKLETEPESRDGREA